MQLLRSQLEAFEFASYAEFDARMVAHLRYEFPEDPRPSSEFVRVARVRATGYGLRLEFEICLFLYVLMLVGEDFAAQSEHTWIERILSSPEDPSSPDNRIEGVFERVMEERGMNGDRKI